MQLLSGLNSITGQYLLLTICYGMIIFLFKSDEFNELLLLMYTVRFATASHREQRTNGLSHWIPYFLFISDLFD